MVWRLAYHKMKCIKAEKEQLNLIPKTELFPLKCITTQRLKTQKCHRNQTLFAATTRKIFVPFGFPILLFPFNLLQLVSRLNCRSIFTHLPQLRTVPIKQEWNGHHRHREEPKQ